MAAVFALSACAVGPNYAPPKPAALAVPSGYSVAADPAASGDISRWWEGFHDAELTRLIVMGRGANLHLAVARARLAQAREALVQARAGNMPTVGASAGYARTAALAGPVPVGSANNLSLGADAAYQVDLFGGRARGIEAARADAEASHFTYGTVMLSIEAEIANNYLLARLAQTNLANARGALANQSEDLQIARWRLQAGLISNLDVEQARTLQAQTAAAVPALESNLASSVARLGVLLGRAPGDLRGELAVVQPMPVGLAAIPVGLPTDLLRQRPDVRVAERQLAAATARIGVAEAALYPALSLGGTIGAQGSSIKGLFDIITGQAFANLAQSILDGGLRRSQLRSQRAAAEAAMALYKQAVLTALEDTENAITALIAADQRQASFTIAQEAAARSAALARLQYRSGLIDFVALLGAENLLLSSQDGLAQARHDRAAALVQLYTALGGGWDGRIAAVAVPASPLAQAQDR